MLICRNADGVHGQKKVGNPQFILSYDRGVTALKKVYLRTNTIYPSQTPWYNKSAQIHISWIH